MNILLISQDTHHLDSMYRHIDENVKPFYENISISILSIPIAFDSYDKSEVDIIITDIIMSGKNGIQIISEAKRHNKRISIIALSDKSNFNYLPIATMLGADAAIAKPIDSKHFADTVLKLIEQKHVELVA